MIKHSYLQGKKNVCILRKQKQKQTHAGYLPPTTETTLCLCCLPTHTPYLTKVAHKRKSSPTTCTCCNSLKYFWAFAPKPTFRVILFRPALLAPYIWTVSFCSYSSAEQGS